jgi:flagellar motor component MotA
MTYEEFTEAYFSFFDRAYSMSEKSRREGLLILEDFIDYKKVDDRDIFEYGMRFVIDGTDTMFIDKLLSNIIKQEKDIYKSLLMTIKKEAVLAIQEGWNHRMFAHLLSSYTNFPLSEPRYKGIFNE